MKLLFEWDRNKARENLRKHKVSFEEAKTVFNDPLFIMFADEGHSQSEERFIGIGMSLSSKILLVVYMERLEAEEYNLIRIISCRKATVRERKTYEEK
jgi:uncharacterized DUF497 family protein